MDAAAEQRDRGLRGARGVDEEDEPEVCVNAPERSRGDALDAIREERGRRELHVREREGCPVTHRFVERCGDDIFLASGEGEDAMFGPVSLMGIRDSARFHSSPA